jgi:hypothetical protein
LAATTPVVVESTSKEVILPTSRPRSPLASLNDPIFVPADELTKYLIPDATLTPLPIALRISRSIVAGLEVAFASPPGLVFKLGEIQFNVKLNGGVVAICTITGVEFREDSKLCRVSITCAPCMTSSAPVLGFATTSKGVLKGLFAGAINGLLYGEWGAGATVIEICNLQVCNEQGRKVTWISDIVSDIPLEYDIDAARKGLGAIKSGKFKDGVLRVAAGMYESAAGRCVVM